MKDDRNHSVYMTIIQEQLQKDLNKIVTNN